MTQEGQSQPSLGTKLGARGCGPRLTWLERARYFLRLFRASLVLGALLCCGSQVHALPTAAGDVETRGTLRTSTGLQTEEAESEQTNGNVVVTVEPPPFNRVIFTRICDGKVLKVFSTTYPPTVYTVGTSVIVHIAAVGQVVCVRRANGAPVHRDQQFET